MEKKGIAVVAVGGNALIKDKAHKTVEDQFDAAKETMSHIVDMIEKAGMWSSRMETVPGWIHPASVRTFQTRAARSAAGLLRCGYPGRYRLYVPESPAQ